MLQAILQSFSSWDIWYLFVFYFCYFVSIILKWKEPKTLNSNSQFWKILDISLYCTFSFLFDDFDFDFFAFSIFFARWHFKWSNQWTSEGYNLGEIKSLISNFKKKKTSDAKKLRFQLNHYNGILCIFQDYGQCLTQYLKKLRYILQIRVLSLWEWFTLFGFYNFFCILIDALKKSLFDSFFKPPLPLVHLRYLT